MNIFLKSTVTCVVLSFSSMLFANASVASNPLQDINVAKLTAVAEKDGLQPKALRASLNAYAWAYEHHKLGANKNTLTVVDFTLPSYQRRMFVIDLKHDKVLMDLYTTQGKGSGLVYAKHFSNRAATNASNLGLQVTSGEYFGKHGKSMRIIGLERGINDHARSRAIVIHSAFYATPAYIKQNGRAGRSWGCYAVAPSEKAQLLNDIQGGSALFTYAKLELKDPVVKNGPLSLV